MIKADELKPEKEQTKEKDKTVLPLETFVIGEVIQDLINKIEHTRASLM
jgi:hypothetical protein